MCHAVRWPRSSSSFVAPAAPANWSTATNGTEFGRPASTATTGTPVGRFTSASAAPSCGVMTRMPSTPCTRSRSIAPSTEVRSMTSRLTIVMK